MWPLALHVLPWVEVSGWDIVLLVTVLVVLLPAFVQWVMERQSGEGGASIRDKRGYPAIVGCSIVLLRWSGLYLLAWYLPGLHMEGTFGPVLADLAVVASSLPLWVILARIRRRSVA
jgi:hypothetical protein